MTYCKGSQSEYNKKCLQFKAQYRFNDIGEGECLTEYLNKTGQSANSYIKGLIKADLDSKGFMLWASDRRIEVDSLENNEIPRLNTIR